MEAKKARFYGVAHLIDTDWIMEEGVHHSAHYEFDGETHRYLDPTAISVMTVGLLVEPIGGLLTSSRLDRAIIDLAHLQLDRHRLYGQRTIMWPDAEEVALGLQLCYCAHCGSSLGETHCKGCKRSYPSLPGHIFWGTPPIMPAKLKTYVTTHGHRFDQQPAAA